jgi:2-iminobutanoate/2-iminopropanoate deaminase
MAARETLLSPDAPAAIGPYSQGIAVPAGRLVFLSGQIPLDPATGQLVTGDIEKETERVMQNLGAVLAAAGGSFASVVKTTIFLADMGDFATVNSIYAERFSSDPPARATVQAAKLPRDARVEIDAIAIL